MLKSRDDPKFDYTNKLAEPSGVSWRGYKMEGYRSWVAYWVYACGHVDGVRYNGRAYAYAQGRGWCKECKE